MACPTCDHTMQGIHIAENRQCYWCPRCGTLREVFSGDPSGGMRNEAPTWIERLREEKLIGVNIVDGFLKEQI